MNLEEKNFELNNKIEQLIAQKKEEEENLKLILSNREELQPQIISLEKERDEYKKLNDITEDRIGPLAERISQLNDEIEALGDEPLKYEKENERYLFEKTRNEILMETSEDRDELRKLNKRISSLYQKLDLQAESRICDLAIQIGELQQKINTRDTFLRDLNFRKENNLNGQIAKHTNKRIEELKAQTKELQSKIVFSNIVEYPASAFAERSIYPGYKLTKL